MPHHRCCRDDMTRFAFSLGALDHARQQMVEDPEMGSEVDVDQARELSSGEHGDGLRVSKASIVDDDCGDAVDGQDRFEHLCKCIF